MPEIQKYSLKDELLKADQELSGSPSLLGKGAMTFSRYNNSTRTQMYASHLEQAQTLLTPEVPYVSTSAENTVGKHSSGYMKLKTDITVYRKVKKFKNLIDGEPYIYQLFYFDHEKNQYDVLTRQEAKDLQQVFGYKYDNRVIDELEEGEQVKKGTVLYKSTSYDDDMNYRFGDNLKVMYTNCLYTAEDSAKISRSASEKMAYIHSSKVKFNWNHNDIPLNLYGDDEEYLPIPRLGQYVDGYVVSSRPYIREQILHDLAHRNLSQILDGDRTYEYNGTGMVIDYNIYCNVDEIPDDIFHKQLKEIWEEQCLYWQEIQNTCLEIMNSGEDYSPKIDRFYTRSMEFLNQNKHEGKVEKWFNGTSVYGYVQMEIWILERCPLGEGGKFTARYGNKSVVSKVVEDWEMPFDEDGEHVDVELNILSINNRTAAFIMHEMYISYAMNESIKRAKGLNSITEQKDLLFSVVRELNEKEYTMLVGIYNRLDDAGRRELIDDILCKRYTIIIDCLDIEDLDIFYKIRNIRDKFPWIKEKQMYIYKFGQIYPIMNEYAIGNLYMIALKQTDNLGFSARNTGAIDAKGLPKRSYKNKRHESVYSDTPIRFGEYENTTWLSAINSNELNIIHTLYRTSGDAISDLTNAQFVQKGYAKFKKYYKSRAAEIFSVLLKSLGLEIIFEDSDNIITSIDNTIIYEQIFKGKIYLCTDWDMYLIKFEDRIRSQILEEYVIIDGEKLEQLVQERIHEVSPMIGPDLGKKALDKILNDDDIWKSKRIKKIREPYCSPVYTEDGVMMIPCGSDEMKK